MDLKERKNSTNLIDPKDQDLIFYVVIMSAFILLVGMIVTISFDSNSNLKGLMFFKKAKTVTWRDKIFIASFVETILLIVFSVILAWNLLALILLVFNKAKTQLLDSKLSHLFMGAAFYKVLYSEEERHNGA